MKSLIIQKSLFFEKAHFEYILRECNIEFDSLILIDEHNLDRAKNIEGVAVGEKTLLEKIDSPLIKKIIFEPFNKFECKKNKIEKYHIFNQNKSKLKKEFSSLIVKEKTPSWIEILTNNKEFEEFLKKNNIDYIKGDIIENIIEYLSYKKKYITFAESCTGGKVASYFIKRAGASNIIKASFVTYSNEMKHKILGVDNQVLIKYGAVSKECVAQMCTGAIKKANSQIAIAISGIAGPSGAVEGKPVGTVYIGVLNKNRLVVNRYQFKGDRNYIQTQSLYMAIEMAIESFEDFFDFFKKFS